MTLSERDRRALLILGCAVIGTLLYVLIADSAPAGETAAPQDLIAAAEKRLDRVRQLVTQVPSREEQQKQMLAQLEQREKKLLQADTPAQAQAQLRQIVARTTSRQTPPVDIKASEFGQVKPLGADYGEVPVSVMIECGVDQLLNIVAELSSQPEMIAVNELRIYSANHKTKTANVRLTVSAAVPKRLAPERKGGSL
ncbi:MAG: hypothetical protein JNK48_09745 [Bryobacterales bacterium]|nr:hypothetical protein [Bryobacterales bacterium]